MATFAPYGAIEDLEGPDALVNITLHSGDDFFVATRAGLFADIFGGLSRESKARESEECER